MKFRIVSLLLVVTLFTACVSIPKETVTLSQTLGSDLKVLHNAHRNIIRIHFEKIRSDVNSFVDDIYAPFIIHYVLKSELKKYKEKNPSLFGAIEIAGQQEGKIEAENALNEMFNFQDAARKQIESKRNELLSPIIKQELEIVMAVNQSYEHAIYANSTITAYLQTARRVKGSQQEALSMIGIGGVDTLISNSLVNVSEQVEDAVKTGKGIDIQSNDAYEKIEKISNKIKEITNKK